MFKRIIVLLIVLSAFVYGQEKEESKNSIGLGAKALIFEFRGIDNLGVGSFNSVDLPIIVVYPETTTVNVGGIGGKYFMNPNMAIRGGLLFGRQSVTIPASPDDDEKGKDGDVTATVFGLTGGIEYHFMPTNGRISPYFGGEIGYYHASQEYKPAIEYPENATGIARMVYEVSGMNMFNITGLLGAEIFIIKEISLSAEYQFYVNFMSGGEYKYSYEWVNGSGTLPTGDSEELESLSQYTTASRAHLILSIYF